jgi:hypothetical protein
VIGWRTSKRPGAHRRLGDPDAASAPVRRGDPSQIYLQRENLQSINSFKVRGATNASSRHGGWYGRPLVNFQTSTGLLPARDRSIDKLLTIEVPVYPRSCRLLCE